MKVDASWSMDAVDLRSAVALALLRGQCSQAEVTTGGYNGRSTHSGVGQHLLFRSEPAEGSTTETWGRSTYEVNMEES